MMKESKRGNHPPPLFIKYGGEYLEMIEGDTCTVRFDVKEEDYNPLGIVLGGVYGIYFDLAMGPFSYFSVNQPCTSLDLNIDFLKPIGLHDKNIIVTAKIIHRSKNYLLLSAEAFNKNKDLLATAKSRMKILEKRN